MSGAAPNVSRPRRAPGLVLIANWTDVVLATYRVPAELLKPYVPPGSELDTPDGSPDLHLLSVVALRFSRTRVRGIPLPTAQDFPEVNLRFYVRRGSRRAAVFLREFVPTRIMILGARLFYRQPYFRAEISHAVTADAGLLDVHTRFHFASHHGEIRLRARNEPFFPPVESEVHFLKEHYWGFDQGWRGKVFRYRVAHPVWRIFPVEQAEITIDPGALLGGAWRNVAWPRALHSVVFAEGSEAVVYAPEPMIDDREEPR